MPPKFTNVSRKNSIHLEVVALSFFNFNFPFPTREEIEAVKEFARSCPEMLDGRELRIIKEFLGGDFE